MANYSKNIKAEEDFIPDAMQRFAFTGPIGTKVWVSISGNEDDNADFFLITTTEDEFNVVDNVVHGMVFYFSNDVTVLY